MRYPLMSYLMPDFVSAPLFGDRKKWGLVIKQDDPCWKEWTEKVYFDFYYANQKSGAGKGVNDAGYKVMGSVDMAGKRVLEIGPGDIRHLPYWKQTETPPHFVIADIEQGMLQKSSRVLSEANVPHETRLLQRGEEKLPFADNEFDMVVSFYSLEHIYPLPPFLDELKRVIKPGGELVGAIPTEGGLAWGLGRYLTSRRWLLKNTNIDPDKLICWEHPNFCDLILKELDARFQRTAQRFWPLFAPLPDFNLVIKFVYKKA